MKFIPTSKVHAFIIIGSSNISDSYSDYASAAAYYHELIEKYEIPSENIHCYCHPNYFDKFEDPQIVYFQTKDDIIKKYSSIKDKFNILDFNNPELPKIQDPDGLVYVFIFNYESKFVSNESNNSYWEILYSFFTSIKVYQFVFVDSSCYSGLVIDTYKELKKVTDLIQEFPNEIHDSLTTLFFWLLSFEYKDLQNIMRIINHLQLTDLAYLNKDLLEIVCRIGKLFLSTKYPSYTHFYDNIQNISCLNQFSNFNSELKTNALFVSKTRIEFREEFSFIISIVSQFSLEVALNIFTFAFNPNYFKSFYSFITLITNYKKSTNFKCNNNSLKLDNYLTSINILTSSDSHSQPLFYPEKTIIFNGYEKQTVLSSPFISTMLELLINIISDINWNNVFNKLQSISYQNACNHQFFASSSQQYCVINTSEDSSSEDDYNLYPGLHVVKVEIPIQNVRINQEDLIYYPYDTNLQVRQEEYAAGQLFKEFVFKLNQSLEENGLKQLILYPPEKNPHYFPEYRVAWIGFFVSTSCYIRYAVIHQFDYYVDSFGYLFEVNDEKLKTLTKIFVDTLIKLQQNPKYEGLLYKYDKPFDFDQYAKKYLGYPYKQKPSKLF